MRKRKVAIRDTLETKGSRENPRCGTNLCLVDHVRNESTPVR